VVEALQLQVEKLDHLQEEVVEEVEAEVKRRLNQNQFNRFSKKKHCLFK